MGGVLAVGRRPNRLWLPASARYGPRSLVTGSGRYAQLSRTATVQSTWSCRVATLWDSRHKSSLIQSDLYLLVCQRYIELNPVRAAMMVDPALYRWISYRINAPGEANARVTPRVV